MLRCFKLFCLACIVVLTTTETGLAQFRLRMPFISVDNFNGNTEVDVFPFVSVRRGYGGVAVDAPFTRVRRPRFYGPYDVVPVEPGGFYGPAPIVPYADPLYGQQRPAQPQGQTPYANAGPSIRVELGPGVTVLESEDAVTADPGDPSPLPEGAIDEPASKILKNSGDIAPPGESRPSESVEPRQGGLRIPDAPTPDDGSVIFPSPIDQSGTGSQPPIQPVPDYSIPALPSSQRGTASENNIRQAGYSQQMPGPGAAVRHTLVIPVAANEPTPFVRTVIDPSGFHSAATSGAAGTTGSAHYLTPIPHTEIANYFKPAEGLHIFALIHPLTNQPYGIKLRLPEGDPKIDVSRDAVVFDYGNRQIGLVFARDGSVLMDYGN